MPTLQQMINFLQNELHIDTSNLSELEIRELYETLLEDE